MMETLTLMIWQCSPLRREDEAVRGSHTGSHNDSPSVYDRCADDSEAIAERLELLSTNVSAVQEIMMLGFNIDDGSLPGQVISEFQIQLTYSKDIS